ncbi:MAG: hypothetical protein RIC55_06490 [Pirellulaceae bacterium]
MAATQEAAGKVFDEVFQSVRKAAEANMKLQQEAFQQWANFWTGAAQPLVPAPQMEQVREIQQKWTSAVSQLAHKHREVLDRQYDAAIASLDDALKISDAKTPEEFRQRTEQFYRKTIDCLREMSQAQMSEFQDMVSKWGELATKSGK